MQAFKVIHTYNRAYIHKYIHIRAYINKIESYKISKHITQIREYTLYICKIYREYISYLSIKNAFILFNILSVFYIYIKYIHESV